MNIKGAIFGVLSLAFLGGAGELLRADTLTLKDGRFIQGRVLEEDSSKIVISVAGSKRTFERALVKKINYAYPAESGEGPTALEAASPAATVPQPAAKGNLVDELAQRYGVGVRDVLWVRSQGISDKDLALVFLIASEAQITPRKVVALHQKGLSWTEIENRYEMRPEYIRTEAGPWEGYPYYYAPVVVGPGWGPGWGWGWGGGWRHWR